MNTTVFFAILALGLLILLIKAITEYGYMVDKFHRAMSLLSLAKDALQPYQEDSFVSFVLENIKESKVMQ